MKKKCLYKSHYAYYAYNDIVEWTGQDKYDEEFRCKYMKHTTHAPTKFSLFRTFS